MKRALFLVVALVLLLDVSPVLAGRWSATCIASISRAQDYVSVHDIEKRLKENRFRTTRDLANYISEFGPVFSEVIESIGLTTGKVFRWVDMGAGQGKALIEAKKRFAHPDLEATAVAFKMPLDQKFDMNDFGVHTLEGPIEDLAPTALEKVDLLTDLYGPFSYSPNLRAVLNRYYEVTLEGADLFLVATEAKSPILRQLLGQSEPLSGFRVFNRWGVSVGLKGLFDRIAGFKLVQIEKIPSATGASSTQPMRIHLKRTSEPFSMPSMTLKGVRDSAPPLMEWKMNDG